MHLGLPLFLNFVQRPRDILKLTLIQGVLETSPVFVLLLEFLELFLLLLELGQPRVDVLQEFADLVTLGVRLAHDSERLCASLLVHFRSRHFLEKSESLVVLSIRESCDL